LNGFFRVPEKPDELPQLAPWQLQCKMSGKQKASDAVNILAQAQVMNTAPRQG
jgi:hypothetical protein